MKKKTAKRLFERKFNRYILFDKIGVRKLSKSERKLIKKCTRVLLSE